LAVVWGLTASQLIFWQKDTKPRLNAPPGDPGRFSAARRVHGKQTASLMTTNAELGSFLTHQKGAAGLPAPAAAASSPLPIAAVNGTAAGGAAQPN
jgi:hypothetical protein